MFDKVFDVKNCYLQPDPSNALRLMVKDLAVKANIPFFNLRDQTGFLRTITIRTTTTGEVMVILQVTSDRMEWTEKILSAIKNYYRYIIQRNVMTEDSSRERRKMEKRKKQSCNKNS